MLPLRRLTRPLAATCLLAGFVTFGSTEPTCARTVGAHAMRPTSIIHSVRVNPVFSSAEFIVP